jgi:hypothetical protein
MDDPSRESIDKVINAKLSKCIIFDVDFQQVRSDLGSDE